MKFTKDEQSWIKKCRCFPNVYRIDVDNDCIFVTDINKNECVFTFKNYGTEFIIKLLTYIGCNAENV